MSEHKPLDYQWARDKKGLQKRIDDLNLSGTVNCAKRERGADREQWFITVADRDYVVFVEHLAESAWLEMTGRYDAEKLDFFYKMLGCNTLP